ncbi:MAG: hypothetical protein R6V85_18080 [Polyangia bacterium]
MRSTIPAMLLALALISSACAFSRMRLESESLRNQWVLVAKVRFRGEETGKLYAVVYEVTRETRSVRSFRHVPWDLGKFVFLLEPGHDYRVAVFHDLNEDLVIDPEESIAWLNSGNRIRFSEVSTWKRMRVSMEDAGSLPEGFPRDLAGLPPQEAQRYYIAVGELADLSQERFSAEAGMRGLWEPYEFLRKHGMGIYMLEPYDPERIPVLFVSGAGGNPHNWSYFFERLDRSRYQPWYYLYPSGVRIFRLGEVLHTITDELHRMHGFGSMVVVAHSMGGLVAHELVTRVEDDEGPMYITDFFSISTPWNGHSLAKSGVDNLSTPLSRPIPSWHDVVPGSRFLQSAFSRPFGDEVRFHLLFSYLPDAGGDGTVPLASQLLPEAQDEACEVRGFESGHLEILSSDDVFEYLEKRLPLPDREIALPREAQSAPAAAADDDPEGSQMND